MQVRNYNIVYCFSCKKEGNTRAYNSILLICMRKHWKFTQKILLKMINYGSGGSKIS